MASSSKSLPPKLSACNPAATASGCPDWTKCRATFEAHLCAAQQSLNHCVSRRIEASSTRSGLASPLSKSAGPPPKGVSGGNCASNWKASGSDHIRRQSRASAAAITPSVRMAVPARGPTSCARDHNPAVSSLATPPRCTRPSASRARAEPFTERSTSRRIVAGSTRLGAGSAAKTCTAPRHSALDATLSAKPSIAERARNAGPASSHWTPPPRISANKPRR
mmetsp:Transcript_63262/g.193528  ORF Transcript_63262/g.193528 Transcript_63262/m.193528 type:complete len:222 (+) Transcript_63262:3442-4107(+)